MMEGYMDGGKRKKDKKSEIKDGDRREKRQ